MASSPPILIACLSTAWASASALFIASVSFSMAMQAAPDIAPPSEFSSPSIGKVLRVNNTALHVLKFAHGWIPSLSAATLTVSAPN